MSVRDEFERAAKLAGLSLKKFPRSDDYVSTETFRAWKKWKDDRAAALMSADPAVSTERPTE